MYGQSVLIHIKIFLKITHRRSLKTTSSTIFLGSIQINKQNCTNGFIVKWWYSMVVVWKNAYLSFYTPIQHVKTSQ